MKIVEILLPAEYDNEWLLRVIASLNQIGYGVRFHSRPLRVPTNTRSLSDIYPYHETNKSVTNVTNVTAEDIKNRIDNQRRRDADIGAYKNSENKDTEKKWFLES